jgi:hypothetical protein
MLPLSRTMVSNGFWTAMVADRDDDVEEIDVAVMLQGSACPCRETLFGPLALAAVRHHAAHVKSTSVSTPAPAPPAAAAAAAAAAAVADAETQSGSKRRSDSEPPGRKMWRAADVAQLSSVALAAAVRALMDTRPPHVLGRVGVFDEHSSDSDAWSTVSSNAGLEPATASDGCVSDSSCTCVGLFWIRWSLRFLTCVFAETEQRTKVRIQRRSMRQRQCDAEWPPFLRFLQEQW